MHTSQTDPSATETKAPEECFALHSCAAVTGANARLCCHVTPFPLQRIAAESLQTNWPRAPDFNWLHWACAHLLTWEEDSPYTFLGPHQDHGELLQLHVSIMADRVVCWFPSKPPFCPLPGSRGPGGLQTPPASAAHKCKEIQQQALWAWQRGKQVVPKQLCFRADAP